MRREHIRRQHGLVRGSGETRPQQRARQVNPLKHRGLGPYRSRAGGDLALLRAHFGAKVAEKFWKRLRDKFAEHRYGRDLKNRFHIIRAGHSQAFRTLREAIMQRRPVRLSYGGTQQTACPISSATPAGRSEHSRWHSMAPGRETNQDRADGSACVSPTCGKSRYWISRGGSKPTLGVFNDAWTRSIWT